MPYFISAALGRLLRPTQLIALISALAQFPKFTAHMIDHWGNTLGHTALFNVFWITGRSASAQMDLARTTRSFLKNEPTDLSTKRSLN